MKIIFIYEDKTLGKDGVFFTLTDISLVPSDIHALQWDGESGHIEYQLNADKTKPVNNDITQLPDWVSNLESQWDQGLANKQKADAEFKAIQDDIANLALKIEQKAATPIDINTPINAPAATAP